MTRGEIKNAILRILGGMAKVASSDGCVEYVMERHAR
jgi:hypothetical protein